MIIGRSQKSGDELELLFSEIVAPEQESVYNVGMQ